MVSSVVRGMKSHLHSLPLNLVAFDSGLARCVETLESVPVLFWPDAVLHDAKKGTCHRKTRFVNQSLIHGAPRFALSRIMLWKVFTSYCSAALRVSLIVSRSRSTSSDMPRLLPVTTTVAPCGMAIFTRDNLTDSFPLFRLFLPSCSMESRLAPESLRSSRLACSSRG